MPSLKDYHVLLVGAFLRALATGLVAVLLGIHLSSLSFNEKQIGATIGTGLTGAAFAALIVTMMGNRIARKATLILLALLHMAGGLIVANSTQMFMIGIASFLGMLNGMGRDRGASLILDQAILPSTTREENKTRLFAWYNVSQDAGHALGGVLAGIPYIFREIFYVDHLTSLRWGIYLYAFIHALTSLLYLKLSSHIESQKLNQKEKISPHAKKIIWKISSLFGMDSFAGGFLTTSFLTLFFYQRFHVSEGAIGLLFFFARIGNALSHFGAAWLSQRIGLINTMVFTHIPSSLFLVTVTFAPNFWMAAILFLLREGLVEMDVPTRQSYVMAVVNRDERIVAAGVTHLVRLLGWAIAPFFAGWLITKTSLALPLIIGAVMKVIYDVLLYVAFKNVRPAEEVK